MYYAGEEGKRVIGLSSTEESSFLSPAAEAVLDGLESLEKSHPDATTFTIVRHGQTVWNSEGRWQGWLDSPLTDLGEAQAAQAAALLHNDHIDTVYSSPSGRAMQTAQIIVGERGCDIVESEELRERYYGEYEGLNSQEIERRFPNTRFCPERHTRENWRPPGGETMVEVRERVNGFLATLAQKHPGQSILIVTHSGVVRVIDSMCCGKPLDMIWHRTPENACVFQVRWYQDDPPVVLRDHVRRSHS